MTAGLLVKNSGNVIQIDANRRYVTVEYSGLFTFPSSTTYYTLTFPSPILSEEPPLVFARIGNRSGSGQVSLRPRLIGSSGNWTGVRLQSGNTTQSMEVYWAVATNYPNTLPEDNVGLRILDDSNILAFTSARPIIRFSRFFTSWTLTYSSSGVYEYTPQGSPVLQSDEYVLLNQYLNGGVAFSRNANAIGITITPNQQLIITMNSPSGGGQTNIQYFPLILAKLY